MNKKVMLVIPILIGLMFVLPFVSASATAWFNMTLTANANVTTGTNNVTTTVAVAALYNVTNVTCFYNVSGGASYPTGNVTKLGYAINGSAGDTSFTITGTIATESTRRTNVTCAIFNDSNSAGLIELAGGNSTISVMNITVDGTAPTVTLTLDTANIGTRGTITESWTATESRSGMMSFTVVTTTPDSQKCPTITSTNTVSSTTSITGNDALTDEQTMCSGDYTTTVTAVDYSGNSGTTSKTFRATMQGKKGGSNTLGGGTTGPGANLGNMGGSSKALPLGETGTSIAIILIIGAAAYLFFKRKN